MSNCDLNGESAYALHSITGITQDQHIYLTEIQILAACRKDSTNYPNCQAHISTSDNYYSQAINLFKQSALSKYGGTSGVNSIVSKANSITNPQTKQDYIALSEGLCLSYLFPSR